MISSTNFSSGGESQRETEQREGRKEEDRKRGEVGRAGKREERGDLYKHRTR